MLALFVSGCTTRRLDQKQYAQFGQAVSRVTDGMSRAEVIALLGQPTGTDRDAAVWEVTSRWSTTSVYVHFDKDDRVYHVTRFQNRKTAGGDSESRPQDTDPLPRNRPGRAG